MSKLEQKNTTSFLNLIKRFTPIAVLLVMIGVFFLSGAQKALNFDRIALVYSDLEDFVADNVFYSIVGALIIYIVAIAISLPISWLLSLTVGLIFGWKIGSIIIIFGATIGASILFLSARYAFADFFKKRSGSFLNKMAKGFRKGAASYLLFLRFVPAFPFTLVNVMPAILGVSFFTFVWTTFVGIIPGVFAYVYAGEGLRSIVKERAIACEAGIAPCGQALKPADLVTKEILIAFLLLGIVSLMPLVIKAIKGKNNETS